MQKNNKKVVHHYQANNNLKNKNFDEEFSLDYEFEDRPLELMKQQNRQLSKENKNHQSKPNKTAK